MPKTRKKPSKPYKDYPLFAHATGQWAKKIRGRTYYFGVWSDTEAALKKYLAERDWLQAGEEPPADTTGTSLADLCNQFLTAKQSRVHSRELTLATFNDYKRCCDLLVKTFGKQRPVERIGPSDFTRLRGVITSKYGPSRTKKEIVQVRMIFNWGYRQELIESPRFGPEFVTPSRDVLRRHRQSSPVRMFEAEEIRLMLKAPNAHTRAWILLGINCGFIQKDVSDLTVAAVDFEAGIIDFPRRKTAVERRAPLWPETLAALEESLASRWSTLEGADGERFFITRQGNHLVRDLKASARSDAVHDAIQRLQDKLEINQHRRSFGAFRHTFRTIADETCDFPAILRVMGHSDNSISDHYRERISDERLRGVVNHVRDWLFAGTMSS